MNLELSLRSGLIRSGKAKAVLVGEPVEVTPQGYAAMADLQVSVTRKPARSNVDPGLSFTPDVPGCYRLKVSGKGLADCSVVLVAFPAEVIQSTYRLSGKATRDEALNVISSALSVVTEQATESLEGDTIPKSFGLHGVDLVAHGGAPYSGLHN